MFVDVGVLLSRGTLRKILRGRLSYEFIELYDRFARQIGLQPIFFSPEGLSTPTWQVKGVVRTATRHYRWVVRPIPSVIHNRIKPLELPSGLKRIQERGCVRLFNGDNRLDKWKVYELLRGIPRLKEHLPETEQVSSGMVDRVNSFLQKHPQIYLKPCDSSLARGIYRVEHAEEGKVRMSSSFGEAKILSTREVADRVFQAERPYLVQQGLDLFRLKERRPVDIRVSVQKGEDGNWSVSGMVAKVGIPGAIATNLTVGGSSRPLNSVLSEAEFTQDALLSSIEEVSLLTARTLDDQIPGLADLGLDIGVDSSGKVWLIEVNGRDLRITFLQAGEREMWEKTFQRPMQYAGHLVREEKRRRMEQPVTLFWTPGALDLSGKESGSVETSVREVSERIASNGEIHVLGRGGEGLIRAHLLAIDTSNRRSYLNQGLAELRRLRPDLIQVENRPELLPEVRMACPRAKVLLSLHSGRFLQVFSRSRLRLHFRFADGLLVNSRYLKNTLVGMFPEYKEKVWIDYPGVDPNRFSPAKESVNRDRIRVELGLTDKKVILFVGRVVPQKGVHLLVSAFRRMLRDDPDLHLLLIGSNRYGRPVETAYVRKLKKEIRPISQSVTWIPYTDHEKMPGYYQASDLLVTPSVERESFDLVNLEGMACGLPLISARTGGIPEVVVEGKTGILLSETELKRGDLADACTQLLNQPEKRRQMGERGRSRAVSFFTWDESAKGLQQIHKRMLRETPT